MHEKTSSANKTGWILSALMGGLLVWILAGCAHHRDQARYRGSYSEPPPQVESSYYAGIRSESDFYEPLSPYGRWEIVGSYGRCWIPGRVDRNWRPYSNGYWQRTDAGWYWASDEPWGWATYHYGRWDFSSSFGWYWVPQTQWAPAWVSWREGGGYIGWAPLPPSSRFSRGGSIEVNVGVIAPRAYVFVEQRRFLEPVRPTTVIVNNTTIINQTVNITNIKVVNNTVINEGPRTTVIEQASGRKLQPVPARELRHKEEAAVVAKHPAIDRKNPAPVRSEAEPQPPVTKKQAQQADHQKRATKLKEEQQAQQERTRAAEDERDKREVERRAEAQAQNERKAAEKHDAKLHEEKQAQQEKARAMENEKGKRETEQHAEAQAQKEQKAAEKRAKHEQADNKQAQKKAAKEDHKKNDEEQEMPPEDPAVSPRSSQ
jgi:hypothetical protein